MRSWSDLIKPYLIPKKSHLLYWVSQGVQYTKGECALFFCFVLFYFISVCVGWCWCKVYTFVIFIRVATNIMHINLDFCLRLWVLMVAHGVSCYFRISGKIKTTDLIFVSNVITFSLPFLTSEVMIKLIYFLALWRSEIILTRFKEVKGNMCIN